MTDSKLDVDDVVNNRYKIVRPLGEGAMGGVYLALDTLLGENEVALKVLHQNLADDKDLVKRFFREVELMNKVNHSAIARTFDVGQDDRVVYFSMEYLNGVSLDTIIDPTSLLPVDRVCHIIMQVCDGLRAIHSLGIVHRDLKPGNIMLLENDVVKITDFGIARNQSSELTEAGAVLGTLEYMAPEMILGHKVTHHADLYSMGCILYKLLCGKLPFDTTNAGKLLLAHVEQPVIPPVSTRPELPLWLSHLTMKLLAKTTRERIQTAEQALDIIRSHLNRGPGSISGAYNRDDPDVAERREAAKASASRRTGDPEIAELLKRQKRAKVMSTVAALAGFIAFVLYPTIRGVQTYWSICDLLMLGLK